MLRIIDKIFRSTRSKLSNNQILFFYNVHSILSDSRVKFKFVDKDRSEIYICEDAKRKHYFSPISRGVAYIDGFKKTAFNIAMSYGVDKINFQENDVIIDVGANNGNLGIFLRDYIEQGLKYYAIEPGEFEFESLLLSFSKDAGSKVYKFAAHNKCEIVDLFYSPLNADSSIFQPPKYDKKISVQARTLDCFIKNEINNTLIRLIKIEAEGSEYEVCLGLEENLKNVHYISIDLGFERGINQESPLPETINFLLSKNFRVVSITQPECLRILFENNSYAISK